jgi:hypothetical protein
LQSLQTFLALEWIYEETAETKSQPTSNETSNETLPLIMPPREELVTLLELAEIGCITGIQETFIGKEREPQFAPFISKVEQFVAKYQFEQLVEFIEPHIRES